MTPTPHRQRAHETRSHEHAGSTRTVPSITWILLAGLWYSVLTMQPPNPGLEWVKVTLTVLTGLSTLMVVLFAARAARTHRGDGPGPA